MDNKERMNLYGLIKQANAEIVPTDIKGKNYAEVNQRIKAFRMVYPDGFILTEMVSNENGVCVFHATVGFYLDNDSRIIGTGTAYEKEDSTFINKTSYIENAETSAVGRALGMAGFGIDVSVASAEEVQNAMANQGKQKNGKAEQEPNKAEQKANQEEPKTAQSNAKATPEQIKILSEKYTGENLTKLLKVQKVEKIEDILAVEASGIIAQLKKRGMIK